MEGYNQVKSRDFFESLNVPCIKRREFCNIQSAYVMPAVYRVWKKNQEEVLKDLPGKVVVASDMQVDSPGHSAVLGSRSTLDVDRNLVLDTQIVQVCKLISSLTVVGYNLTNLLNNNF